MNIYLIRHARQASTLCNVNVSLSEAGESQARLLAKRLEHYSIDAIYSSDLLRAVETAGIINKHLIKTAGRRCPYVISKSLREFDYGELEGIENDEVKKQYHEFFKERDKFERDLTFPGGECGQQVFERAYQELLGVTDEKYQNIAVVTHGGTIRSLLTGLLGLDQAKKLLFGLTLENCSITQLYYNKHNKRFYLERFNDFAHLEGHQELLRRNWTKEN